MGLVGHKRNSKFTWIGLLGQKRADIFKFAIFVQNSPRNYEFLEISVFCQKRKENKRFSTLYAKGRATVNLAKLLCAVNNVQETSIRCFR